MSDEFLVEFGPGVSREQAEAVLLALEAYWVACGGMGFGIEIIETEDDQDGPLPRP